MIKYLLVLPFLFICFSNVNGQTFCYPETSGQGTTLPGAPYANNPAGCVTVGDPDPAVIIPIPDFDPTTDCESVTPVTFDMVVVPDIQVHYHYWGNCSDASPVMPGGINANRQGYIQQMFCDVDGDGLPAFPAAAGGLSNDNGIINFLPQDGDAVGGNGFADAAANTCIAGDGTTGPESTDTELIQLDFWVAIPNYQTQVGFLLPTGNPADAASFFVGPNTGSMCEVAYYKIGNTHAALPDQPIGTYNVDHSLLVPDACNTSWLRVRLYISDFASRFEVIPEINCGNGYVPLSTLPIVPAMSASDNAAPAALTTMPVAGYLFTDPSGQVFLYDEAGVGKKYACNPVPRTATTTELCPLMCPADLATTAAPGVTITAESVCPPGGAAPAGGLLSPPATACPAESTLEYSIDGGANWTTTLPTYDDLNSITVTTRCVCDIDSDIVSMTTDVPTTPGVCVCEADAGTFNSGN